MRMLQAYKSKKYLLRILLSVTILMVMVLSLASVVLHYSSETRVVQMQKEANRKVMSQIIHNISYMQEIVRNSALTIYNDNQIIAPLMSGDPQEDIDVINAIRLLSKAQSTSAFLHSVLIYNGHVDRVYAEGALAPVMPDHYMTKEIVKALSDETKLPQMRLLPMNISRRDHSVDFFSMIMYETFLDKNRQESALVLNVKPEWIFDNLKVLNDFAAPDRSSVLIMDEKGKIIFSGDERNIPDPAGLSEAVARDRSSHSDGFGFFSFTLPGEGKHMVTYMNMGIGNWKVITIQPYYAVLGGVFEMRMTSILVIVCFLIVSIVVSVVLAHKLYKPVEAMIARVRRHAGIQSEEPYPGRDELSYVTNMYSDMARKLHLVTNEQDKQRSIIRNYHLRSILTGSTAFNAPTFTDCVFRNGLNVVPDGPFLMVVVKIDENADFIARTNHAERLLYSFAISNIVGEMLAPEGLRCETAEIKSDHLAMLVSGGPARSDPDKTTALFQKVQDIIQSYYKLSISIAISETFTRHEEITEQYGAALQYSMYKLVFGKKAIITPELVKPNVDDVDYSFPAELEKKLIEAIKTNDPDTMTRTVDQLLAPMSAYHYDHIIHGILHLVDIIKSTLREINKHRVVSVTLDLSTLNRQVLEKETIEEIAALLRQVCHEIHDKMRNSERDKNTALMDVIREIVASNYQDINLSLQSIASMLKMTPAYVGRIFKQSEIKSVGEYINEVRLSYAREFVETKNFSIKEIMELVGYLNESTFFKLFKKKYGVTPREYRLKRNIG